MAKSVVPEMEFAVTRDELRGFFSNMPVSTFNDLVKRGVIVPLKGVKRYYQLNRSLLKMGMQPLKKLSDLPSRAGVDSDNVKYLALHLLFPQNVPWPLEFRRRDLTLEEQFSAIGFARIYVEQANQCEPHAAHAFIDGVLESIIMLEKGIVPESGDNEPSKD